MVFGSYWYRSQQDCDCNEVERLQQKIEDRDKQEQERREARRQEIREAQEYYLHNASDWKEALQKQAWLYQREANNYPEFDENGIDSFAVSAEACVKAIEFWEAVETGVQPEIEVLEAKIQKLRDSVRLSVVARLRKEYSNKPGGKDVEGFVTTPLENGDDPSNWLNW